MINLSKFRFFFGHFACVFLDPFAALQASIAAITIIVCLAESLLFQVMVCCLGALVRFLWQKSPAHTSLGKHARNESPQKRRAVVNVLAVVVPSVIVYFPVWLMVPFVIMLYNGVRLQDVVACSIVQLSTLFPSFSVFIGPLFYLSRARQTCCSERQEKHLRKKGGKMLNWS